MSRWSEFEDKHPWRASLVMFVLAFTAYFIYGLILHGW